MKIVKHMRPVVSTVVSKLNDISISQTVTYILKLVISWTWCRIIMLLLWITSKMATTKTATYQTKTATVKVQNSHTLKRPKKWPHQNWPHQKWGEMYSVSEQMLSLPSADADAFIKDTAQTWLSNFTKASMRTLTVNRSSVFTPTLPGKLDSQLHHLCICYYTDVQTILQKFTVHEF